MLDTALVTIYRGSAAKHQVLKLLIDAKIALFNICKNPTNHGCLLSLVHMERKLHQTRL